MEPSVPPHAIRVPAAAVDGCRRGPGLVPPHRAERAARRRLDLRSCARRRPGRAARPDPHHRRRPGRARRSGRRLAVVPGLRLPRRAPRRSRRRRSGCPACAPALADTWIRIARNRPAAVAVTSDETVDRSAAEAARDLVDGHLAPVVDAVAGVGHGRPPPAVGQRRRLVRHRAAGARERARRGPGRRPAGGRRLLRGGRPVADRAGRFEIVQESGQRGLVLDPHQLLPVGPVRRARRAATTAR